MPFRSLALVAFLLLGAGAGPGAAASDAAGEAAGGAPSQGAACARETALRVQARYEGVRDLRGRFRQTTWSVALGEAGAGEEARGEVVFAKPGRMRWSYQSPEPSLVVSDGRTLWIFDPTVREVQVLPVDQGFLSGAAIQFLLGQGRILDAFTVETRDCEADPAHLVLVPREPATYERLELRVDRASGEIRETEVLDLFGNRTRVAFEGVRTNSGPPDSLFRFEAPPGTRVLEVPAAGSQGAAGDAGQRSGIAQ
jgi:outer membrane lipoprotein carrier protein